jgi:hypothetical protein
MADRGGSEYLLRFDALELESGTDRYWQYPGVLIDPASGLPYFSTSRDFDVRWRKLTTDATAMDPEPLFKQGQRTESSTGIGGSRDTRLLIYDDASCKWHDVTYYVEGGRIDEQYGLAMQDAPLFDWRQVLITDDRDPDPDQWGPRDDNADGDYEDEGELAGGVAIRADWKYTMRDPDPAHCQALADATVDGGTRARVSIYRKMPVRWYGGSRQSPYLNEYEYVASYEGPLGDWIDWDFPADTEEVTPAHRNEGRGVGFLDIRTNGAHNRHAIHLACQRNQDEFWRYKGDYVAGVNEGGWPNPLVNTDGIAGRQTIPDDLGRKLENPRQYGIITFDASFDGTKVALLRGSSANYRPDYYRWMLVDYVELTDAGGKEVSIGESLSVGGTGAGVGTDPLDGSKILSWQARNIQDNRSNCDGYMCWDLLPMTVQNPDHTGASVSTQGFNPWWIPAYGDVGIAWWANETDGFFAGINRVTNPNPLARGLNDLENLICHARNLNDYVRDFPVKRQDYDGTRVASKANHMGRNERMHAFLDFGWEGFHARQPRCKEHTMGIPTGVGRSCDYADTKSGAAGAPGHYDDPDQWPSLYAGRQDEVLKAGDGWTWYEANKSTHAANQQWAAYSWNCWSDLYRVTDLCQHLLWDVGVTSEDRDIYDGDQDGERDEIDTDALSYSWSGGATTAAPGEYVGERKQINKLNLNELWYPPTFAGTAWRQSYTSFARKPLKGFHSPSDAEAYHYTKAVGSSSYPGFHDRITRWNLDDDSSLDFFDDDDYHHYNLGGAGEARLDAIHCGSSPVYTIFVSGSAVDDADEPLAEMRARVTVERTWDGRTQILEFTWLLADRGFME